MNLIEFMLSRLYNAAARYYLLKEIGEPESVVEAAEVRSEMFSALLDVNLSETVSIEGKWYDAGLIRFGWKDGVVHCQYEPSAGNDAKVRDG